MERIAERERDMERLTKRLQNGKALCIGVCEKECVEGHSECHKCKPFVDVIKKLAEYEDAEEQGQLLSVSQANEWRKAGYSHGYAYAIRELKQRFRNEYEEMMELEMEDCINWADWLDATAEQILADMKG